MATRADAIANARQQLHSGAFLNELNRRVAYRTESQNSSAALRCVPISSTNFSRRSRSSISRPN